MTTSARPTLPARSRSTPSRPARAAAGGPDRSGGERVRTAAWMISPAIVLFILFLIIPIVLAFGLAFTNARLISPRPAEFIGLDNFAYLFTDPVFWASLRNTFYFAVVVVPVQAGLRAAPRAARQRQGPRHQLLPHHLLPARRHLDGRRLAAVALHVPDGRPDQPGSSARVTLRHVHAASTG